MEKKFKLSADEIQPLASRYGACFATDKIVVDGDPVRYMYREQPDNESDSGWRFMSGYEDDNYMADPNNHGIYDVNTIANYDPTIVAFLDAAPDSAFDKVPGAINFVAVKD